MNADTRNTQHTPGLAVVHDEGNYEVSLHGRPIGYYFQHRNTLQVRGSRNEDIGCAGTHEFAVRILVERAIAKATGSAA